MATGLTGLLAFLPDDVAVRVAVAARRVAAIRIGTRQHLCATLWSSDVAVACAHSLPEQDSYLLLLDDGHAVCRLVWRDEASGLAGMQLDTRQRLPAARAPRKIAPDGLLISVGIDETGTPVAGLAVLHETPAGAHGPAEAFPAIDRNIGSGDFGGPLIAPSGALVGIVARGGCADGTIDPARLIPHAAVARLVAHKHAGTGAPVPCASLDDRKLAGQALAGQKLAGRPPGWLGVGLQPIAVPRALRHLAGQNSGRMVIDIIPDGPADRAGLLSGDIVLTLAERSMVGAGAVRDFLSRQRIGKTAEMILLRAGELISLHITVSKRPPD